MLIIYENKKYPQIRKNKNKIIHSSPHPYPKCRFFCPKLATQSTCKIQIQIQPYCEQQDFSQRVQFLYRFNSRSSSERGSFSAP